MLLGGAKVINLAAYDIRLQSCS